jgi:predicted ATPase/class 3 adenylate cyclase
VARLPEGTITFMLTDLEGSTRAWERQPQAMRGAMARHDAILAGLTQQHEGELVEAGREGDSILAVFRTAATAATCALHIQQTFAAENWPDGLVLKVRIALHTGEAQLRDGHYFGPALNRCARLLAACHPGQVLMTKATQAMLADEGPPGSALLDLGLHRLKDLVRSEQVFQLDDLARPIEFPPIRSLPRQLTNLPLELTTFVGRKVELEQLHYVQSHSRLLALIGPSGVGKTRLAIQLASYLRGKFADGVWLVELAPVRDGEHLPQAVAEALDVPEQANRALTVTLVEHLRERETFLFLDNCEHIVDAVAHLAETLLRSCPRLNLLVTSREALNVPGEATWWVPPLEERDAVKLFVDRAGSVGYVLRDDGIPIVAGICRRLDCLPLAIELAAARSHMMPVEDIEARLSDRFSLLTGGSRTAAERQQTLEAAVDWSYDQLSEPERVLFGRLAVFSGRFSLSDAEAVGSGDPLSTPDVLGLIFRLVDKSLLVAEEGRYRLLETMREYGLRRLSETGHEQEVRELHAHRFLAVAKSLEPGHFAQWLDRVEEAHDNCRAALGWAVRYDRDLGLLLADALFDFWHMRGHITEARGWLEALLDATIEGSPLQNGARVQLAAFSYTQNELAVAQNLLEDVLNQARRTRDAIHEMHALKRLSLVLLALGEPDRGNACAEEALSLALALGDRLQESQVSQNLGVIRGSVGDFDGAGQRLARSVAIQRELGRGDEASTTLALLAAIHNLRGDHASADVAILESLQTGHALKNRRLGWTLDVLASRLAEDRPREAQLIAGAASAMHASVGIKPPAIWQALLTSALAPARAALGEEAATKAWDEGRQMPFEEAVTHALTQA